MRGIGLGPTVLILAGIILIVLPYVTFVFAIPPFYTVASADPDKRSGVIYIDPGNTTILWPLNKTVGGTPITCRPDFNYSLNVTISPVSASTTIPVNVTVFAAGVAVYEVPLTSENNYTLPAQNVNGTLPRSLDIWRLGLEKPLEHGHDVYVSVTNTGNSTGRIRYIFSARMTYTESMYINFVFFVIGIILLIGSGVQFVYTLHVKRVEEKVRKLAETETTASTP